MTSRIWEASLFGLLRVRCGERTLDRFLAPQTALLFAYLAAFPQRHSREAIIGLFWPDADPESGRRRLSQALWRIRQDLDRLGPDLLLTDRGTVGIDPAMLDSDILQFRQALIDDPESAVEIYEKGEFLAGFYDPWVLDERDQLQRAYLDALQRLIGRYEKDQPAKAIGYAERAVAADPLVEETNQTLIRLLVATGRHSAALRHYREFVRLFNEQLGFEPSAETEALLTEIRRGDAPRTSSLVVAPLPASLTTFRGRQTETDELAATLLRPESQTRLVTLLGTSGVGKTRLALELGRGFAREHEEPVVAFVPLADIREARLVSEAIANAVTADQEGPPMPRIVTALGRSRNAPPFLLILDNAEHLTAIIGTLVKDLLTDIPRLRILVTSQRPLGIEGEVESILSPLALPDAEVGTAPSVELFIDRARVVRPDFAGNDEVGTICERLEGLPLAIELCAAWAQTLSTSQMLAMLGQRFDLLVSRRADIPARHRTLRAAMEYSYLQLPEDLRQLFVNFAVFEDGWTLEAAAAVCTGGSLPSALTALARFQEHSLVVASERRPGDGMRYRMLESLREFATEQRTLGQRVQHQTEHAHYYASFVQAALASLSGVEYARWSSRIDEEYANIRQALTFLLSGGDPETALTLTCAISAYWNRHGKARESREWLERALPIDGSKRLRARLLTTYADSLRRMSEFNAAASYAEEAYREWKELDDAGGVAEALMQIGSIAALSGDFVRAQEKLDEAVRIARELEDERPLGEILNNLAGVAVARQEWDTAWHVISEALALERKLGNSLLVSYCLSNLSLIARYRGDYAAARRFLQELLDHRTRHNFYWDAISTMHSAIIERLDGNYALSLQFMNEALDETKHGGETRVLAWCVKEQGHLAIAVGAYAVGLRLLSRAETLRESLGMSFKPLGPEDINRDRAAAVEALGEAAAETEWSLGKSESLETLLLAAAEEIRTHL